MESLRDYTMSGNSVGVQLLINRGGCDLNEVDARGLSPLHIAATKGDVTTAIVLIEGGADKDKLDAHRGLSPISCAARNGHEYMINFLVHMGCNTNTISYDGLHMNVMIPMDTLGHYKHNLNFTGRKTTAAISATLKILEAKLTHDKIKYPIGVTLFTP
jgi:ankyrin repeat protein